MASEVGHERSVYALDPASFPSFPVRDLESKRLDDRDSKAGLFPSDAPLVRCVKGKSCLLRRPQENA